MNKMFRAWQNLALKKVYINAQWMACICDKGDHLDFFGDATDSKSVQYS